MENQPVIEPLLHEIDEILRRDRCLVLKQFNLKCSLIRRKNCDAICHGVLFSFLIL